MKERPIIYTAESIRAILDGRKTQTRRVIRSQPVATHGKTIDHFEFSEGYWWPTSRSGVQAAWEPQRYRCPYGVPGDRLWAKETWATWARYDDLKPSQIPRPAGLWWKAGGESDITGEPRGRWRSARFMCRWMSRLTQAITRVRVEQVQQISQTDAMAEGVLPMTWTCYPERPPDYAIMFWAVWDRINANRGYPWAANPWVWVLDTEAAE